MLWILGGAIVGAVIGAVGSVVVAETTGQPVTWSGVISGTVGGAIGGAVIAATAGLGTGAVIAAASGGAAGAATTQATENLMDGRPVTDGVVQATVIGAVSGPLAYGAGKYVVGPLVSKAAPQVGAILARLSTTADPLAGETLAADPLPAAVTERPAVLGARGPPARTQLGLSQIVDPEAPLGSAVPDLIDDEMATSVETPADRVLPFAFPERAPDGNLVVWRAVSDEELAKIQATGQLAPRPGGKAESFLSSTKDYVAQLAAKKPPGAYRNLLRIELSPDAIEKLQTIGALDRDSKMTIAAFPNMKIIATDMPDALDVIHFKAEKGTLTFGYRKGSAQLVNSLIQKIEVVSW